MVSSGDCLVSVRLVPAKERLGDYTQWLAPIPDLTDGAITTPSMFNRQLRETSRPETAVCEPQRIWTLASIT